VVLLHVNLAMVHEVQDGSQVTRGNIPEHNDWVRGRVLLEKSLEGDGAGGEDDLVSLDLFPVTGDGHVHVVILVSQFLEGALDTLLEVIPPKAELLIGRTHLLLSLSDYFPIKLVITNLDNESLVGILKLVFH